MAATADSFGARARAAAPGWWRRTREYLRLIRLNRPVGIWLLLWPTLWALWCATGGHPARGVLLIFVLGTVLMRSAGCVVNDLADRDFDRSVRRTRERPLAARHVSPYEALVLFGVLVALALLLVLQLNWFTIELSFIGAALTVSYPLMKRFFPMPQMYLGMAFGWGVPMAFAATTGTIPRAAWVMFLGAIVWAGVYDTLYAMADRDEDLRIGLRSSAILFGDLDLIMVGAMQFMVLLALWLVGQAFQFGWHYRLGLLGCALCFGWQQWLARDRGREGCFAAFKNNQYAGALVFAGLVWEYWNKG
ncbi:MAG TPA: 4-hydroxybenzoate octaprenyltransferase [Steroidobacteraceae bacterium]|nr:4-hydroxybenzoate octaprenyltransferase [Steroidobacteraceae bacterium]